MDKAIVIGTFHFFGFHVCNALLNKGMEVTGIFLNELDKIPFLDEKQMEVGRNSNFRNLSIFDLNHTIHNNTKQTFIFSFYDYYMLHRESKLMENKTQQPIMEFIEQHPNLNVVLLLPIQMQKNDEKCLKFIESMRGSLQSVQAFYLPSIYGPWQPSTFIFQQIIRSKFDNCIIKTKSAREWTNDIIFVDDAVQTLIELIENETPGNFLLESGKEHYWDVCARFLQADEELISNKSIRGEKPIRDIVSVPVKKISSIADSLSSQIEHERWLYQSKMVEDETESDNKGT